MAILQVLACLRRLISFTGRSSVVSSQVRQEVFYPGGGADLCWSSRVGSGSFAAPAWDGNKEIM